MCASFFLSVPRIIRACDAARVDNFEGVHPSPRCAAADATLFAVVLLVLIIIVIVEVVIHQRFPPLHAPQPSLSLSLSFSLERRWLCLCVLEASSSPLEHCSAVHTHTKLILMDPCRFSQGSKHEPLWEQMIDSSSYRNE